MNQQQWLKREQQAREQGVQSQLSLEAQVLTDEEWESAQGWAYDLRRRSLLPIRWKLNSVSV